MDFCIHTVRTLSSGGRQVISPILIQTITLYYQMVGKDGDFIVGSDIGNFDFRTRLRIENARTDLWRPLRVAVPWMMVKFREYCPQAKFLH
jgi:hypothetical protein